MANFAFLVVIGVTNFKQVQLVLFSSCFPSKFLTRSNCIFLCSLQHLSRITSYFHNTYTEWRSYGCFTHVHNVDGTLSFPRLLLRCQLSSPWLVFGANRQRSTAMSISLFLWNLYSLGTSNRSWGEKVRKQNYEIFKGKRILNIDVIFHDHGMLPKKPNSKHVAAKAHLPTSHKTSALLAPKPRKAAFLICCNDHKKN